MFQNTGIVASSYDVVQTLGTKDKSNGSAFCIDIDLSIPNPVAPSCEITKCLSGLVQVHFYKFLTGSSCKIDELFLLIDFTVFR